jgi:[ribosomal protein S5]-alanine N-acetyltransferase
MVPILKHDHVTLRALTLADALSIQRHGDNPRVAINLFDAFPQPYTAEKAELWCSTESHDVSTFGYVWGIVVEGEAIGCIGLRPEKGWLRCNAEIGYWIGEPHWNRGITPNAVALVVDWAWQSQPEITRICASVFSWNPASQAVLAKNGFVKEGVALQSAIKNGEIIDRVIWAAYRSK